MQETTTIHLSQNTIQAIINNTEDKLQLLDQDLLANQQTTGLMLAEYHRNEKGNVSQIEIAEGSLSIDAQGKGSFEALYNVNISNGCADINYDFGQHMTIRMNVNLSTGTCLLIGEEQFEREPDEF